MSEQVKGVSEVVKAVADINKMASDVSVELRRNIADVTEALELTRSVSSALGAAGAALRAALAPSSNNPPPAALKAD